MILLQINQLNILYKIQGRYITFGNYLGSYIYMKFSIKSAPEELSGNNILRGGSRIYGKGAQIFMVGSVSLILPKISRVLFKFPMKKK